VGQAGAVVKVFQVLGDGAVSVEQEVAHIGAIPDAGLGSARSEDRVKLRGIAEELVQIVGDKGAVGLDQHDQISTRLAEAAATSAAVALNCLGHNPRSGQAGQLGGVVLRVVVDHDNFIHGWNVAEGLDSLGNAFGLVI